MPLWGGCFTLGLDRAMEPISALGYAIHGIDHIGFFCGGSAVLEFELTLHEFEFACLKF